MGERSSCSSSNAGGSSGQAAEVEVVEEGHDSAKTGVKRKKKKKKPAEVASTTSSEVFNEFGNCLLCPITLRPMTDPVVCADGHSYERRAVEEKRADVIDKSAVVSNIQLKQAIQAWLQAWPSVDDGAGDEGVKDAVCESSDAKKSEEGLSDVRDAVLSFEALMAAAVVSELNAAQRKDVMEKLKDPQQVLHGSIQPFHIRALVEYNPDVAIECLMHLASRNQLTQYLVALIAIGMSLNSLQVVHRLIYAAELPANFVHSYIMKCLRSCSDKSNHRMPNGVRLVCLFILDLLRNNKIKLDAYNIEFQAFCIEFSNVREAAALHRFLKASSASNDDAVAEGTRGGRKIKT